MSKGWKVVVGTLVVLVLLQAVIGGYLLINGQVKLGMVIPIPPIPAAVFQSQFVGTWHADAAFGGVTTVINADSTATVTNGLGDSDRMSWREQGNRIYLTSSKYQSNNLSGDISSDGKSMTLGNQHDTLIFVRQ